MTFLLAVVCVLSSTARGGGREEAATELYEAYLRGPIEPENARSLAERMPPAQGVGLSDPTLDLLYWSAVALGNSEPSRLQDNDDAILYQLRRLFESYDEFRLDPKYGSDPDRLLEVANLVAYAVARQGAVCPNPPGDPTLANQPPCNDDPHMDLIRLSLLRTIAALTPRSRDERHPSFAWQEILEEFLPLRQDAETDLSVEFSRIPEYDDDALFRFYLGRHHLYRSMLVDPALPNANIEAFRVDFQAAQSYLEQVPRYALSSRSRALALVWLAELHYSFPQAAELGGIDELLVHQNLAALRSAEALVHQGALGTRQAARARFLFGQSVLRSIHGETEQRPGYLRALAYARWLSSVRNLDDEHGLDVASWDDVGVESNGDARSVLPLTAPDWPHLPRASAVLRFKIADDWKGFYLAAVAANKLAAPGNPQSGQGNPSGSGLYDEVMRGLAMEAVNAAWNAYDDKRIRNSDRGLLLDMVASLRRLFVVIDQGGTEVVPARNKDVERQLTRLQVALQNAPSDAFVPDGLREGREHPPPAPGPEVQDQVDLELLLVDVTTSLLQSHRSDRYLSDLASRGLSTPPLSEAVMVPAWMSYVVDGISVHRRVSEQGAPARRHEELERPVGVMAGTLAALPGVDRAPVLDALPRRLEVLQRDPAVGQDLPWLGDLGYLVMQFDSLVLLDAWAAAQDAHQAPFQREAWGIGFEEEISDLAARALRSLCRASFAQTVRFAGGGDRDGLWYHRADDHSLFVLLPAPAGELMLKQNRGPTLPVQVEPARGLGTMVSLRDGMLVKPFFHE